MAGALRSIVCAAVLVYGTSSARDAAYPNLPPYPPPSVCAPPARDGVQVAFPVPVSTGTSVHPAIGSPPSVKSTVPPVCGTGAVVIVRSPPSPTVRVEVVGLVSMVTRP